MLHFVHRCFRLVLEYTVAVWHTGLTTDLSDQLETIQKRTLRIIFGGSSFTNKSYERFHAVSEWVSEWVGFCTPSIRYKSLFSSHLLALQVVLTTEPDRAWASRLFRHPLGRRTRPGSESESERKRARNASSESERDFFSLPLKRKISSSMRTTNKTKLTKCRPIVLPSTPYSYTRSGSLYLWSESPPKCNASSDPHTLPL